ncbi:papain family cysteine protease [Ancylostoma duodenale]|uniref:Papain family cysteine protease n=1 Tax=Ancylostoma duodenale TaxID=51022 RepID=A0A0C2HDX3_9BILA|nr:papain family cysteine protease [Ancylostoma duodenale]
MSADSLFPNEALKIFLIDSLEYVDAVQWSTTCVSGKLLKCGLITISSHVDSRRVSGDGTCRQTDYEEFLAQPVEKHVEQLTGQAFVDYINEHQSFYRAKYSPEAEEFVKSRIMDSKFLVKPRKEDVLSHVVRDEEPPKRCEGGWPIEAYRWMKRDGVVTGGKYGEKNTCKPYAFYPCGRHQNEPYYGPCPRESWPTPKCRKMCQRKYKKSYKEDKHFAKHSFYLPNNETSIRQEIFETGPVVAAFNVYEDFRYYKGGIYVHKWGKQTGAHAVKVIGWGTEDGTDYWLIANSWNTEWGENGYFRIVRGINNCGIEEQMVAGLMKS